MQHLLDPACLQWDWLNDSHYVWFAGVYDYWGIKYDRGDVQILVSLRLVMKYMHAFVTVPLDIH
jgi:hypothetical protein